MRLLFTAYLHCLKQQGSLNVRSECHAVVVAAAGANVQAVSEHTTAGYGSFLLSVCDFGAESAQAYDTSR